MRVNIESTALAETRFHKLSLEIFNGSRVETIGFLVLFWFESQEREIIVGSKEEITKLFPYEDFAFFDALLKFGYLKNIDTDLYEIVGNKKHVQNLQNLRTARSKAAKKGNEIRWRGKSSQNVANESQNVAHESFNTIQLNAVQYNAKQTTNTLDQNKFDLLCLYNLYPRKIGKVKGIAKLKTIIKSQETYDRVKLAIENYSKYCSNQKTESQYIKHFSSFVNSWEDWLNPPNEVKKKSVLEMGIAEILAMENEK